MARLKDLYEKKVRDEVQKELGIKNIFATPKIVKVVVNAGVGRAVQDGKKLEEAENALELITGQKPVRTLAKKSIAGFKIREKMPLGVMVTLRGERMYEFLDKLVNVSLPRVRDFRGISAEAFDGKGNYSLGIKEHNVFPELIGKDVTAVPFQVNIQTTSNNDEGARLLLKALGFPFRSNK